MPFGRGRIVLKGADTAMSVNFYTTKGILVPGIVKKDTEMKVVFKDERVGDITDIFCIPTAELTPDQVAKKSLLRSELDWESAAEPPLSPSGPEAKSHFNSVLAELQELADEMTRTERARADIAGWRRNVPRPPMPRGCDDWPKKRPAPLARTASFACTFKTATWS